MVIKHTKNVLETLKLGNFCVFRNPSLATFVFFIQVFLNESQKKHKSCQI